MSIRIDTDRPTPAPIARSAVEAVEERDAAILAFLADGAASFAAVRANVPRDPDWTDAQHAEACGLAIRRLGLKKLISRTGDTVMLAS
jgi:hypothetical protein